MWCECVSVATDIGLLWIDEVSVRIKALLWAGGTPAIPVGDASEDSPVCSEFIS